MPPAVCGAMRNGASPPPVPDNAATGGAWAVGGRAAMELAVVVPDTGGVASGGIMGDPAERPPVATAGAA
jgi:hypothetical protein